MTKPEMTFEDGRRIAVDMLVELRRTFGENYIPGVSAGWHSSTVRDAWRRVSKTPAVLEGFMSVVTDVLISGLAGRSIKLEEYEEGKN